MKEGLAYETEFEKCFTGYKYDIITGVSGADKRFENGAFQYEIKYRESDFQYINKHK